MTPPPPTGRLTGEIALVTDSALGAGRAIARRFAAEGAHVALSGADQASGEALAAELTATGALAAFRAADLADEDACTTLVDWVVEEYGGLTVLVHDLGDADNDPARHDAAVHDLAAEPWERILRTDLAAAAWLARAAIGAMLDAEHGVVITVAPGGPEQPTHGHAATAAARAGLAALTRSIATDYADESIRANLVRVGAAATDDDVAAAACFLSGREARAVTGVDLPVGELPTVAG
jgi:NAD(P)-dependent dehydrogenase (short-subunit alcohol dehydrogenase family)